MSDAQDPAPSRRRPRRKRGRFLLTAVALSTGSLMSGCGSHQADPSGEGTGDPGYHALPGNPKGSVYDDGVSGDGSEGDATDDRAPDGTGPTVPDEGDGQMEQDPADSEPETDAPRPMPVVRPLPANPKGAAYDRGLFEDEDA